MPPASQTTHFGTRPPSETARGTAAVNAMDVLVDRPSAMSFGEAMEERSSLRRAISPSTGTDPKGDEGGLDHPLTISPSPNSDLEND